MPRPSSLTPDVHEKIVSAIRAGNFTTVAVQFAGISRRTFYHWMAEGEQAESGPYYELHRDVRQAESEVEVRCVAALQKHVSSNWKATLAFLERKFPKRWGRHHHVTLDVDPQKELSELLDLDESVIEVLVDAAARQAQQRAWDDADTERD